jgi:hypothetical protein
MMRELAKIHVYTGLEALALPERDWLLDWLVLWISAYPRRDPGEQMLLEELNFES